LIKSDNIIVLQIAKTHWIRFGAAIKNVFLKKPKIS